ncbi:MAG: Uma2 family endonuclease [Capsulimonas sp.]|uniref:Uma2 family endonuclease n=1 Tax=Capsulimonas sp. TaxID=2494211 RepID=UPI003267A984
MTPRTITETPEANAPAPHRWTREDYYRLGDLGFFPPDVRVELIDGEIIETMSPQKTPHTVTLHAVVHALRAAFGGDTYIREQSPMTLADTSEPEPDILVAQGTFHDYKDRHPGPAETHLLVEVSDSTLAYDRTRKAALYAAASVTEYWIADVSARTLEVRRLPQSGAYQETEIYDATQTVTPLAAPAASILVGDLFP